MTNDHDTKREKFIYSHMGILRVFAIWGILDALIFLLVKDDRLQALSIYSLLFIVLTIYGLTSPGILDLI